MLLNELEILVDQHVEAYRHDWEIDKNAFALCKPGDRVLWMARKCGTAFFPLTDDCPGDTVFWTYWLPQALAIRIVTIGEGGTATVRKISADTSAHLARAAVQKSKTPSGVYSPFYAEAAPAGVRIWPVM